MDQSFLNQWELTDLDQFSTQQLELALGQDLERSPSSESYTSYSSFQPPASTERAKKPIKTSSWSSCTTDKNSAALSDASCPRILSFGNPESPLRHSNLSHAVTVKRKEEPDVSIPSKRNYGAMSGDGGTKRGNPGPRPASHNQEHIMAERKRREKLSQRFIELSAVVPDLKKKVTSLQDQVTQRTVESAVLVKKSHLCANDDSSSSDENFDESLPEIEARVCEKTILIKIHCENRKGILVKSLSEIEKLHLSVTNTSVMPFTNSSLDITVMTQARFFRPLVPTLTLEFVSFIFPFPGAFSSDEFDDSKLASCVSDPCSFDPGIKLESVVLLLVPEDD
ncbi:hypothetical protein B296_00047315 [Ensete ventricosum]|uniref:Plant bHLH transcription factor ACT-like domain-containing protein n=1 Tax=Ensete ventricosum TaxID=4639 RepID=A0A426X5G1_ENSVE|nr:hypothetical protein B296_00047315 [Ensete ventricosum]